MTEGRAFAYIRVSTDDQRLGPLAQREAIRHLSASKGHEIMAWFQDAPTQNPDGSWNEAVSGGKPLRKRKAGRALFDTLQRGDHVYVAKLDRLFRNLLDCVQILDLWKRLGVHVYFCDCAGIDPASPMGAALLHVLAVFAELERQMISQRTKEGLAASTKKRGGSKNSRHPGWGYQWCGRGKNRIREVCTEERAAMRQILQWHAIDGVSFDEIREIVNYRLDPPWVTKLGLPWTRSRIVDAFRAELRFQNSENRR